MQFNKSLGLALASAMGVSTPVFADMTPADVWAALKNNAETNGAELTAQESTTGDGLTLTDITLTQSLTDNNGKTHMSLSGLSFVDKGDGSVAVVCPADEKAVIETELPDASKNGKVSMTLDCSKLDIRVSGTPENFKSTYSGPEVTISLDDVNTPPSDAKLDMFMLTMTGIEGETSTVTGSDYQIAQKLTAETASYKMALDDTKLNQKMVAEFKGEGLTYDGDFTMGGGTDTSNMLASLAKMATTAKMAMGKADWTVEMTEGGAQKFAGSAKTGAINSDIALKDGVIDIKAEADGLSLGSSAGLPFAIDTDIEKLAWNYTMPLLKSDTPQNFKFGFELDKAKLPDILWTMFDPQGKLSHDPLTLATQIDGTSLLSVDLVDPEALTAAQTSNTAIGQFKTLNIDKLFLSALGAEFDGSGNLSFNYNGTDANAAPVPDGKIQLMLKGGESLLDKLIESGLVPQEQAAGVRMMIGLFTKPGTDADTLTSQFEFTADGQILANGQRIK